MPPEKQKWELLEPKRQFRKFFESHRQHTPFLLEFESDVTENPYYHPDDPKKIKKLHPQDRYPPSSYRWRKRRLRIVYHVAKKDKMIWPLEANFAGDIGYR